MRDVLRTLFIQLIFKQKDKYGYSSLEFFLGGNFLDFGVYICNKGVGGENFFFQCFLGK